MPLRRFTVLTQKPEDSSPWLAAITTPQAGAQVVFEGQVRNHHEGKHVTGLTYDIYPDLAQTEGEAIVLEALGQFEILEATVWHREGYLLVGETAVWVGVSAAHRQPAFEACAWIMDEIKARLPIWKKEHTADGQSEWVWCAHRTQKEYDAHHVHKKRAVSHGPC